MLGLFNKKYLTALLALVSLNTMSSALIADDCCCCPSDNRFYIGVFGGQLFPNSQKFVQLGTAFFAEDVGGPLTIDAHGHSKKKDIGYGGFQIGYEWRNNDCGCCSSWNLSTAAEFEALFYRHTYKAHLINPTVRLPEHDFANTFPTTFGVYLLNGVLSFNNCGCLGSSFTPYIGAGVGVANICIHKAKSEQVAPPELGVNHFDSDRTDTTWAFAAQAKAGIRYNFCERFHIFAEYRFLYIDHSRFLFGSTIAEGHAPTSTWNVDMKHQYNNAYAIGIQFDL